MLQRACAALGDKPAAPQAPLLKCFMHDGQCNAVLDAAAGVQELRLAQDLHAGQDQGLLNGLKVLFKGFVCRICSCCEDTGHLAH